MPEGHTIRRQVVEQAPRLVGRRLSVSSPNRRFESGAARVDGLVLEDLDAWGKHLFYFFGPRAVLHVHLGMQGSFGRRPSPAAWVRLAGPELAVDLLHPKTCELIDAVHQRAIVGRLGPDPIRVDDDGGRLAARLAAYPGPIGVAVLDQSVVAGIGNIYRAEILHAAGVHPDRPAGSVTPDEARSIWEAAARMLRAGVSAEPRTAVYRRRRCGTCGGPVRSWRLVGREAWACESCQR
jgi:endonuclease-8